MPVNSAEIIERVRTIIVEVVSLTEEDFWLDEDILGWYDDWAARQHRQVLDNARKRGDVDAHGHLYLRHFHAETVGLSLSANIQDYDQPDTSLEILSVVIQVPEKPEVECQRVPFADDWRIKSLPTHRPLQLRPYWTITSGGKIRFYFATPTTLPSADLPYVVRYFRDVTRTVSVGDDVDLPDPFNRGPVRGAVGDALTQQQTDPQPYYDMAKLDAENILPAPPLPPA